LSFATIIWSIRQPNPPLSNGDEQVPIVPTTWAVLGQPPSDATKEMPMVTQLNEEKRRLWEIAKSQS